MEAAEKNVLPQPPQDPPHPPSPVSSSEEIYLKAIILDNFMITVIMHKIYINTQGKTEREHMHAHTMQIMKAKLGWYTRQNVRSMGFFLIKIFTGYSKFMWGRGVKIINS